MGDSQKENLVHKKNNYRGFQRGEGLKDLEGSFQAESCEMICERTCEMILRNDPAKTITEATRGGF